MKITLESFDSYLYKLVAYQILLVKKEFTLMDSDGRHLQQLTQLIVPGYPESQTDRTVVTAAQFVGAGSQMRWTVMRLDFTKAKLDYHASGMIQRIAGPIGHSSTSAGLGKRGMRALAFFRARVSTMTHAAATRPSR